MSNDANPSKHHIKHFFLKPNNYINAHPRIPIAMTQPHVKQILLEPLDQVISNLNGLLDILPLKTTSAPCIPLEKPI